MKICVAVIFGGKSTEHEVSCISANQVINAINKEEYDVLPIYLSKNNEFYIGDKLLNIDNYADIVSNPDAHLEKVSIYKDGNKVYVKTIKKSLTSIFKEAKTIDIAFPVVHGTNVEDGSLAGYLQMLDLPFTSCDVLGGAIGQDKAVMKDVLLANGLPMVEYFVVHSDEFESELENYKKAAKRIGYPLIAKPANLGSSIGIEIIKNEKEFEEKISKCLNYDFKVVVEKMITKLKEVNISVIGSQDEYQLSVIEEVTNGFLDYDKKYQGGGKKTGGAKKIPAKGSKGMASTNRKVPADIKPRQKAAIEVIAARAFKCLNAHGCVRIDFMINELDGEVYINEINTIPGSLAFYLWEASGMSFEDECDYLIKNALRRYREKEKKTYSFETNILEGYRRK